MTLERVSADRPTAHDSLGRRRFVARLADQVRLLPAGDSGYVLGLTGAWGSGKSQVIELLKEQLAGDAGIVVLELNPWYFSGVEDLVGYVFDELRGQLSEAVSAGEVVREASGTVRRVAAGLGALASLTKTGLRAASYLGAVPPVLADAAAGVLDVASKATKAAAHVAEGATALEATAPVVEQPSLRKARLALRQALGAAPFRLLVIIDDLDRLEDDEIRTMMRVVRMMADLPNVIHLVAFDLIVPMGASSEGLVVIPAHGSLRDIPRPEPIEGLPDILEQLLIERRDRF